MYYVREYIPTCRFLFLRIYSWNVFILHYILFHIVHSFFFRSDISLLRLSMTELNFPEIAFMNESLLISLQPAQLSRSTACSVK